MVLDPERVAIWLGRLVAALECREPGPASTRMEVVEIDLALDGGRVRQKVEEAARVPPVDLVLEMLDGLLDLAVEAGGAGQG